MSDKKKTIFDIPDEILVQIILYLTPKERVPLAKICPRFNSLVFEDRRSLRYLDFSKGGHSVSDIEEYFNREITCQLIRGVNVHNFWDAEIPHLSDICIGKATNLVDINIHRILFEGIQVLESFMEPLLHVRRLSFDWRRKEMINVTSNGVLQERFSKLTYLSVDIRFVLEDELILFRLLKPCQELKELRISLPTHPFDTTRYQSPNPDTLPDLRSLEIVSCRGFEVIPIKRIIGTMLRNPKEWTDFQLNDTFEWKSFYLEKNVQVCGELLKVFRNDPETNHCNVGRVLVPADLMQKVIHTNHENVPRKFCCLSKSPTIDNGFLKIEEVKRWLKDPGYQISSLHIIHDIERNCDVHLIASAFPNLTELCLSDILLNESTEVEPNFEKRLMRKGDATSPQERRNSMNQDSSFKMLVENTPHLRHFTLKAAPYDLNSWDTRHMDFDALHLISGWKNLETLCFKEVQFEDCRFLTEIARQCKNLKVVEFWKFEPDPYPPCFEQEISEMLIHCKSLRGIRIGDFEFIKPSRFFTLLRNNTRLAKVDVRFWGYEDTAATLVSSIEELFDHCPELTSFHLGVFSTPTAHYKELSAAFERLKSQLPRQNGDINMLCVYPGPDWDDDDP